MKTPMHLRNVRNNRIFAYTEELASRPDMVPFWTKEARPSKEEIASLHSSTEGGLALEASDLDAKSKTLMRERDKQIINLERQLDAVGAENQKLHAEIDGLKAQIEALVSGDPLEVPVTKADVDVESRMNTLVEATKVILKRNDPNDFTGANMPRVETLEAEAGIGEVTGQERTEAYHTAVRS